MKVKFKKLSPDAVTPTYAKPGDAGLDITAISAIHGDNYIDYKTGIAVEIPEGYVGMLFPRSSVTNKNMMLKNSVGILDSGYRGEISFRYKGFSSRTFGQKRIYDDVYKPGDRVGQLVIVPIPQIELEQVEELSSSERAEGGYGSSGQ